VVAVLPGVGLGGENGVAEGSILVTVSKVGRVGAGSESLMLLGSIEMVGREGGERGSCETTSCVVEMKKGRDVMARTF